MLDIRKSIDKDALIATNAYFHKFRHIYEAMLIYNWVKIQKIKELLGHWSMSETELYAHNKSDHLHDDVSRFERLFDAVINHPNNPLECDQS